MENNAFSLFFLKSFALATEAKKIKNLSYRGFLADVLKPRFRLIGGLSPAPLIRFYQPLYLLWGEAATFFCNQLARQHFYL